MTPRVKIIYFFESMYVDGFDYYTEIGNKPLVYIKDNGTKTNYTTEEILKEIPKEYKDLELLGVKFIIDKRKTYYIYNDGDEWFYHIGFNRFMKYVYKGAKA